MAAPSPTQPFIWGAGGAALTPEQVARQREIAQALMAGGMDYSPVEHWMAGAARAAQAGVGALKERWANEAETEGRQGFQSQWDSIFSGGGSPVAAALAGPQAAGSAIEGSAPSGTGGDFMSALVNSESGGNWNALNNEGYGGRLQFGAARLADAAKAGIIPAGVTGAAFSQMSPEQQQAVEAWHFNDIDQQAARMGLDKYYGQTIAGVPINQNSIRSMAHLGGIGGAQKFITSGGQYNPADSNGTRLSTYGTRFGGMGGGTASPQLSQVGGGQPSVAQLLSLAGNEWANPGQSNVINALLNQQMQQQDPRYQQQLALGELQMQQAQAEIERGQGLINAGGGFLYNPNNGEWISAPSAGAGSDAPAAFETLRLRAEAAGLAPGTPEYQNFMSQGGGSPENNAREQQISRLIETGIDRNTAINVVDGRWKMDTNPITGRPQITDMATGQPAHPQEMPTPVAGMSQADPAVMQDFGTQFPSSNEAFGVGGAAMGALNTVGDAVGLGAPYPEVQQTQSDFAVLQERLLNDIAGSYGRQPPSWLLQRIDELTPKAGNPLEGSSGAINKLNSLGRDIQTELGIARQRLNRELTPTTREETETTIAGLEAALARIGTASSSFGSQPQGDAGAAPEGVPAELWQVMTPEERALWQ